MAETRASRRELLVVAGAAGIGSLTSTAEPAGAQETDRYNIGTASPQAEQAARTAASQVIREFDWGGGERTITGIFTDEAIDGLRNRPDIRYIEVDGTYSAISQTLPWGVDRVDADAVHDSGETGGDDSGSGGGITIIDTGIDYTHGDLGANYGDGRDFVNGDDDPMDDHGHGTHVAGTADAVDDDQDVVGVCTAAPLHAAKVLDSDGSGTWSDVAAGIKWTADQGHHVGNLSLGGSSASETVRDACQYAYGNGVLLVAAAGNSGPRPDSVIYPAAYEEVIAVSATTQSDDIARFSSRGSEVELAAPGVDILSTQMGGGTTEKSGTSMASPHVAGAGGQLMDNGYTNTEARSRLQDTAEDIGLSSTEQGHGLVDVAAALGESGGGNSAPSVDSLSLSEVETDNADAEFDADWQVSDADGNLSSVDLMLRDDTDGETEDTASVSVSGDLASGTTRLVATGDDGSGNSYTVELTVTDSEGATDSATATATESEETADSAPTIDTFDATEAGSPNPHLEITVNWDVSDADGDLSLVRVTAEDADGDAFGETHEHGVSGSSASGTDEFFFRHVDGETADVTIYVEDSAGNSASDGTQVTE